MTQNAESRSHPRRMPYFPEIYPGEILYSVFARLSFHMAHVSAMDTWDHVYGRHVQRPVVDFPSNLDWFASRLHSGPSADELAMRHTLLPYYTAFATAQVREKAMKAMRGEEGKVGLVIGLRAKPLGPLQTVRFCPACYEEMIAGQGEAYFRREHQLPIVLVCPRHECDLRISEVKLGKTNFLHRANKDTCPPDAPSAVADRSVPRQRLLKLARRATDWLENPRSEDEVTAARSITARIVAKGVRAGSQVDWTRLNLIVDDVLAPLEPAFPGLLAGTGRTNGWMEHTMDPTRKVHSDPLCFLSLVMDEIEKGSGPFGDGPWACENPLAEHFGHMTITETDAPLKTNGRIITVKFRCSCGYVYTRSKYPDGRLGRSFRVRFGPLLRDHVAKCARDGLTITKAAASVGTNWDVLRRHMKKEGILDPWEKPS
ncbi:TnsD family Tn7-like transposition protein [Sphingomonas sp. RIT328]|uniref:TnsD family Tn7-like transposition protein n=1 Tax=Sphingomonas sp. RIT328 TaxID=1470591 RepID=UPI0009E06BAD|nr:TnsD family Tn7-like transposition protein [Sphingomonas sp. RIT328]